MRRCAWLGGRNGTGGRLARRARRSNAGREVGRQRERSRRGADDVALEQDDILQVEVSQLGERRRAREQLRPQQGQLPRRARLRCLRPQPLQLRPQLPRVALGGGNVVPSFLVDVGNAGRRVAQDLQRATRPHVDHLGDVAVALAARARRRAGRRQFAQALAHVERLLLEARESPGPGELLARRLPRLCDQRPPRLADEQAREVRVDARGHGCDRACGVKGLRPRGPACALARTRLRCGRAHKLLRAQYGACNADSAQRPEAREGLGAEARSGKVTSFAATGLWHSAKPDACNCSPSFVCGTVPKRVLAAFIGRDAPLDGRCDAAGGRRVRLAVGARGATGSGRILRDLDDSRPAARSARRQRCHCERR